MLFKGYIDESYNPKIFTLSCLMSNPSGWMWIESGWKKCLRVRNKALKLQGRKQISRYHAADCSSRKGEFEGWTTEEQIDFTKQLLGVLRRQFLNVIAYSIFLDDFLRYFPECSNDPIESCYQNLLTFLMLEMASQVEDAKRKHRSTRPVSFVLFHDRCSYDSQLLHAFNKRLADPTFRGRDMFTTLAPLSWENCIPLQAADLVAYENFKDTERRVTGRNRRKSLLSLLAADNFGGRSRAFNDAGVKLLRETIDKSGGAVVAGIIEPPQ